LEKIKIYPLDMMHKKKPSAAEIEMAGTWGTWSKEPSEFPWSYSEKETCLILEGEAMVTAADNQALEFGAGDLVTFEAGLQCTWKIKKAIRKRYKFG
jgi:uncharacterized cupin superfamily protein